jgi:integrase
MNLLELERSLRQLRLSGMAGTLETRLRQAQAESMAPVDLVASLVIEESNLRSERLIERRRKQAAFRDPHYTLDNFDFYCANGDGPDSLIFPTRNGTPPIPTNWAEDVLKPAGEKIGLPGIRIIGFGRLWDRTAFGEGTGHKPIQEQLRRSRAEITRNVYMQVLDPETWSAVVDLESRVNAKPGSNVPTG